MEQLTQAGIEARREYRRRLMSDEATRERRREYCRQWREKNREHLREYHREWRKNNPDKIKATTARYWNRKGEELEAMKNSRPPTREEQLWWDGVRHDPQAGDFE